MYRLGHKAKNTRRRAAWIITVGLFFLVVTGVAILAGPHFIKNRTSITQSAAVVTKVAAVSHATKVFDGDIFTINLPSDWQALPREKQPYNVYRWQNKTGSTTSQEVEVYVDTIPQNFAVNRVLAIEGDNDHLSLVGSVSDNCADFTKDASPNPQIGTRAKWQGIDFLCDLANYQRNVVGTSSKDGINTVRVQGNKSGAHQFFLTYTDHNINPDYTIFYQALQNFRIK